MKIGKVRGPTEVTQELVAASEVVGIHVISECPRWNAWALRIVVPTFKGKGNIRNCSCNRAVKLLEHGMTVVERMTEKGFIE